ncbi:NAD(P)/FAD-dependent oxidoreductase [Sulfidibacter corallicola]|uniref:Tryptophan 7-halogenase n=1 Tax=Sulfidibacter corallicola TaxID=2818388 RepID=A0A8A4TIE4_SULCO|nr:tryptophan 7-halogenase [Sulfidibacter corallicola]QTD49320.1 tryptophan 7-halogenase [Sulfidibacter corallicola]
MTMIDRCEVVVLGGGPAGCACALALARLGVADTWVIEAGRYRNLRIGECVPAETRHLLHRLGLMASFAAEGHARSVGGCALWGGPRPGFNDALFNPHGQGFHLDRRRFDAWLAAHVAKGPGRLRLGARFRQAERRGGRWLVTMDDGAKLEASFVVDATGSKAVFARQVGARRIVHDRLICLTGFFAGIEGDEVPTQTFLEAVEDGWWYGARLPNGIMTCAFACDPDTVRRGALGDHRQWLMKLLTTRLLPPHIMGRPLVEGSPFIKAAPSFILDRIAGDGYVAVGDAACAFDPISSRGIHKALSDGIDAAEAVAATRQGERDALARYAEGVVARYETYLKTRTSLYRGEADRRQSSFWHNRLKDAPGSTTNGGGGLYGS